LTPANGLSMVVAGLLAGLPIVVRADGDLIVSSDLGLDGVRLCPDDM